MATASHGSAIYPNSGPGQLAGKKAYGASTKRGIRSHNQAQRAMELADLEKRQAELRREIDTLARIR